MSEISQELSAAVDADFLVAAMGHNRSYDYILGREVRNGFLMLNNTPVTTYTISVSVEMFPFLTFHLTLSHLSRHCVVLGLLKLFWLTTMEIYIVIWCLQLMGINLIMCSHLRNIIDKECLLLVTTRHITCCLLPAK